MKLGIWTPLPHTVRVEPAMAAAIETLSSQGVGPKVDPSFRLAADVVKRAEALGFVTTLIAERHLGPDLEAWMLAAALIAETETIELLVAVHPGIFTPQLAAKMGASLDRLSGGRFAVNVVNGWFEEEFDVYGNGGWLDRTDARYRRMEEFMAVMKGLWCEDPFTFDGEFYSMVDARLPTKSVRTPNPPIYAASSAEAGMEAVARLCDVWFVSYAPGFDNAASNLETMRTDIARVRALAAEHGREIEVGISAHVICEDDPADAERAARALEAYGAKDRIAAVAAKGLGAGLVGTAEQIAARMRDLEAIGVDMPMIHFYPMQEGLERFADRVMPLLTS